jgi:alpha-L-arabinofuranosidase
VIVTADAVKAKLRKEGHQHLLRRVERLVPDALPPAMRAAGIHSWPVAPHLLEERYSVLDAVVVGSLLISLLRHADRVTSASLGVETHATINVRP